jgi:hypothetical protein
VPSGCVKMWSTTHHTNIDKHPHHDGRAATSTPERDEICYISVVRSHTPLLVGDLTGLPLVNGVDCFLVPDGSVENASNTPKPSRRVNIIPLSRVSLRGITAVDRRPNGCVLIVLDDGTRSINVLCWDNSCDSSDYVTNEHGIAKGFRSMQGYGKDQGSDSWYQTTSHPYWWWRTMQIMYLQNIYYYSLFDQTEALLH